MNDTTPPQPTVVRTERGLSVAGTRITLYSIMDYLKADWPPKLIRDWLNLSDTQIADVLAYIAEHRDEVEAEYQQVVQQAEEIRAYWEKRTQDHLAQQPPREITPEQAALRAKFEAWRAKQKLPC